MHLSSSFCLSFPTALYILLQGYIHWALDISDMPGAAGTWSMYLAASGMPRDDVAAVIYQFLERKTHLSMIHIYHCISIFFGGLAVFGGTLAGYAFDNKRGALYGGVVFACWPLIHLFGLLSGNDPIAFGLGWFSVGLTLLGCSGKISYLPFAMLGVSLFPFAILVQFVLLYSI